jgi:predicted AlkP superfamily phosphohydrolase/phosphomutase
VSPQAPPTSKVLLIGLDGVTWDVLKPWVDAGHLPQLRRVMAAGAWGTLASTYIPQTPPAWTSMVTGVQPGKHGIFGFVKRRRGTYEKEYVTSRDRCREPLWEILGRAGKRSIVVDLPITFPPEPVNGILISGMGTPGTNAEFVWPPELKGRVLAESGSYEFDIYFEGDVPAFIDAAVRMTKQRLALASWLMREHPWDFSMVVLTAPDRLQHVAWKYIDPRHPQFDEDGAARYGPDILRFYQLIDQAVADLWALGGPGCALLVASDHGFEPVVTKVALGRWLLAEGFIVLGDQRWQMPRPDLLAPDVVRGGGRVGAPPHALFSLAVDGPDDYAGVAFRVPDLKPTSSYEIRVRIAGATAGAAVDITDLSRGGLIVGGGTVAASGGEIACAFMPAEPNVTLMVAMTTYGGNPPGHLSVESVEIIELEDWTQTSAYVLDVGEAAESRRIRVNLQGREPHGTVSLGPDYERLVERLTSGLRGLSDPSTGERVFEDVRRDVDAFPGPCRQDGADLAALFSPGVAGISIHGRSDYEGAISFPFTDGFSGRHAAQGVLLAAGAPFRHGSIHAAGVVDVCPTVLHLLDVPGPPDLDGRVLWETFTPEFRQARPLAASPPTEGWKARGVPDQEGYTEDQRRQVEERLRRLGYLE